MSDKHQTTIDVANAAFWSELCGTQLAQSIGVHDSSPESLKRFDDWYFGFYPYLTNHIPFGDVRGAKVLEIGLGYGTVCQRLAESGAHYTGIDIAEGPVAMAQHRLRAVKARGEAIQGNILNPPHPPESFDVIVAIGCLHHTGDLRSALNSCHKLLKPRGRLVFMVYYGYSYRRWWKSRAATLKYLLLELGGYRGVVVDSRSIDRAAYDTSSAGEAAPHTDWISKKSIRSICRDFSSVSCALENIDQEPPFLGRSRNVLLKTHWPRLCGLDVYCTAVK
jgi:SAM-dependent methyltransferase